MNDFVTIKDLNLVTELEDANRILIDNTKDRDTNTVLLSVLKQYLSSEIKPSISSEGNWIIGGVDTGVNAKAISFDNREILERFSLDTDGFLLYDQNKIATDIKISAEANNILETKQDGLFVERTDLSDYATKYDIRNGFEKIMDEDIEYGEFSVTSGASIVPNSGFVIDNIISGNLKLNNNGIHLTAGKIYKLSVNGYMSGTSSLGGNILYIYNLTKNKSEIPVTYLVPNSNTNAYYQTDSYTFYKPEIDCDISFTASIAINISPLVRFVVEELKQPIINNISIDKIKPDETNNLQDTPIGHIISHIGLAAPKHYLICDGSEYSISEYSYLAEYFKSEFGSYNYYGGDGIHTFSIPDMQDDNVLFCIKYEPTYYVNYNYGGIKETVLWEGILPPTQINVQNELLEPINDYDYILIHRIWNADTIGSPDELIYKVSDLKKLIDNPSVTSHCFYSTYASLYVWINFTQDYKKFFISYNLNETCFINKIIGIKSTKNQTPTLIEGGILL